MYQKFFLRALSKWRLSSLAYSCQYENHLQKSKSWRRLLIERKHNEYINWHNHWIYFAFNKNQIQKYKQKLMRKSFFFSEMRFQLPFAWCYHERPFEFASSCCKVLGQIYRVLKRFCRSLLGYFVIAREHLYLTSRS